MNNAVTDNITTNKTIDLLAPNSVICLMAPTASGKTALAYELYETDRFELISVDSALVYRDMNIGTAKPTAKELHQYPHHLVDIIDPSESYSVANFVADVERLITDIHARGKIPLLIGGTMMYYMALFEGLSHLPDSDATVRAEVEAWRQEVGIEALHDYLKDVDTILGERLNPTDTQRITRAVEVYKQTGKPLSYWQERPKVALANNPTQQWIGLTVMPDRAWVHKRIALRLDIMWQQGLIAEVLLLIKKYHLTTSMASMRCVGYRQVIDYLLAMSILVEDGKGFLTLETGFENRFEEKLATIDSIKNSQNEKIIDSVNEWLDEVLLHDDLQQDMKNKALYATRQLAKRQYTWMRKLIKMPQKDATKLSSSKNTVLNFDNMQDVEHFIHQYI